MKEGKVLPKNGTLNRTFTRNQKTKMNHKDITIMGKDTEVKDGEVEEEVEEDGMINDIFYFSFYFK